uniref:Secreted protein n=1 Tax=Tetranychus urticae TaxID=32264 RepID=T1JUU1_TETUR
MNALLVSTLLVACFALAHGSLLGDVNAAGYQSVDSKTPLNGGGLTGALLGNGVADNINVLGAQIDPKTTEKTPRSPFGILGRARRAPLELDIGLL